MVVMMMMMMMVVVVMVMVMVMVMMMRMQYIQREVQTAVVSVQSSLTWIVIRVMVITRESLPDACCFYFEVE